jgi:CMP-N-acetylneuraminic acid synthetase
VINAIIAARGGSKRLKDKNIVDFLGKPMIIWTIDSALKSKYINKIFVSTESKRISNIVKTHFQISYVNKKINIIDRPDNLAEDNISVVTAWRHAASIMSPKPDFIVCLSPCCPTRSTETIDKCIQMMHDYDINEVFTTDQQGRCTDAVRVFKTDYLLYSEISTKLACHHPYERYNAYDPEIHHIADLKICEHIMNNREKREWDSVCG